MKGSLPWQGLKINNKEERYKKICEIKKNIPVKELCSGLPNEFETILDYVKNLKFTQVPNYNYLKSLLKNILEKNNSCIDFFDWNKEKPKISKDNIIYTNNYNINYNGENEWLKREDDVSLNDEKGTDGIINNNTGKEFLKNNEVKECMKNDTSINNIYYKPVLSINPVPSFINYKINTLMRTNYQPSKTAENSYNDSRLLGSNYNSSRTYIWK